MTNNDSPTSLLGDRPLFDVFVSWTRADTNGEPRALVEELERRGLVVWFDEDIVQAFGPIPAAIREGLAGSRLLVAWYSKAYPSRRACREELTLALLAAEGAQGVASRVLVVNPEETADHIAEVPLLETRFAGRAEMADMAGLATRIASAAQAFSTPLGRTGWSNSSTQWFGAVGRDHGYARHVGRLSELWQVRDMLRRNTDLVGTSPKAEGTVVVTGPGGVGKSILAAEYARMFGSSYAGGVFWLDASGDSNSGAEHLDNEVLARSRLREMARWLGLPDVPNEDLSLAIKAALQRRPPALIIIDGLRSSLTAAELDAWRCGASTTHEIITTRDAGHVRFPNVQLNQLDDQSTHALLTQGRSLSPDEEDAARELGAELGNYPLACDVASLYVNSRSSFRTYLQLLRASEDSLDVLAQGLGHHLPGDYEPSVLAVLKTSLLAVSQGAWGVLRACTFLGPVPIPRKLLVGHLAEVTGQSPSEAELALGRALGDPRRDGLWRYDADDQALLIHPIIVRAAALLDPSPELGEPCRRALVVSATNKIQEYGDIRRRRLDERDANTLSLLVEQARVLTARVGAPELSPTPVVDLRLLVAVEEYDLMRSDFTLAVMDGLRATAWMERVVDQKHPALLKVYSGFARSLHFKGEFRGALQLKRYVHETYESMSEAHPRDAIAAMRELSLTLRALREFDEATELSQRAWRESSEKLGATDELTLACIASLAQCLNEQGRAQEALELRVRLLEQVDEEFPDDELMQIMSWGNIGASLLYTTETALAESVLSNALARATAVLGTDHLHTLEIEHLLVWSLILNGKRTEAIEFSRPLYKRMVAAVGREHPITRDHQRAQSALGINE